MSQHYWRKARVPVLLSAALFANVNRLVPTSSPSGLASFASRAKASPLPIFSGATEKLERYLSKAGAASRPVARDRVRQGDVLVNGKKAVDPWHLVRPGVDVVELADFGVVEIPDRQATPPLVVAWHKPQDVVVTLREGDSTLKGRQGIHDALPEPWKQHLAPFVPALRPVGRLDAPSEGLLIMTDDSSLAATLTTPGGCDKEYVLRVSPIPNEQTLQRLRDGVNISNPVRGTTVATRPCTVDLVSEHPRSTDGPSSASDSPKAVLRFIISEGMNRQLRRMCGSVGLKVLRLMRVRVGPVKLGRLPAGEARQVTAKELAMLQKLSRDGNKDALPNTGRAQHSRQLPTTARRQRPVEVTGRRTARFKKGWTGQS